MSNLRAIVALGGMAHDAVLRILGPTEGSRRLAFSHGAVHQLPDGKKLFDSYHVSQLNTFTGLLTPAMFASKFPDFWARDHQAALRFAQGYFV